MNAGALVALSFIICFIEHASLVESLSTGAPSTACDTLMPASVHGAQQTAPSPYSIDLSEFNRNSVLVYIPDQTYAGESTANQREDKKCCPS